MEEEYFLAAVFQNTIPVYNQFLSKYPDGRFAEETENKIKKLIEQRHMIFRNVNTVNFIIKDTYGKMKKFSYPFEQVIKSYFETITGWKVSINANNKTDAVITINSDYNPEAAYYHNAGSQYTYASIKGTIVLTVPGIITIKEIFKGKTKVPERISASRSYPPYRAPFWPVFHLEGTFLHKFVQNL